jgi:hypothetical protein
MNKAIAYQTIKTYFADKPVNKVMVFGSFARNEQTSESDIDIIIKLNQPLGLFALSRFRLDLTELLGIPVDLTTEKGISKFVYPYIEKEIEVLYEQ